MSESPITTTPAELVAALRRQGIADERVLAAIATVDRAAFLPPEQAGQAWANAALPIAAGQTISQPYVVAAMTQALRLAGGECVLEIGTGSGYQAAILAACDARVWSVERHAGLAEQARALLAHLGVRGVDIHIGDGSLGRPEHAPYDGIIVTAAAPSVPPPLLDQLSPTGGRLVIPTGTLSEQRLIVVERAADTHTETDLGGVRFVPLLGEAGWPE